MDHAREGSSLDDQIPSSLAETTAALATALHCPDNLGIEFRPLRLRTRPETDLLISFIQGVADEASVRQQVTEPLVRLAQQPTAVGRISPEEMHGLLPALRVCTIHRISQAVDGMLEGDTALFFGGTQTAVLVATGNLGARPSEPKQPSMFHLDAFGVHLMENVALIRRRVRDAALVAEPASLPHERARKAAVLYRKGRADPALVDMVKVWLQNRSGQEALHRGVAAGVPGLLGMLPDLASSRWPDNAATLVDAGYVVVLVDRLPYAFIAPVTAPALLLSPGDENLRRGLGRLAAAVRVILGAVVLTAPAAVVALINYHAEMVPTPFLLVVAGTRETAAFPIMFEMLALEVLQEVFREAAVRMPLGMSPGNLLIAGELMVLILVQSALVGPLPAVVSALVAVASLGLTSYDAFYLVRTWRFFMIIGAGWFGFLGLAFVLFMLMAYLSQARSFGTPFLGSLAFRLTTPGGTLGRGGNRRDPGRFVR